MQKKTFSSASPSMLKTDQVALRLLRHWLYLICAIDRLQLPTINEEPIDVSCSLVPVHLLAFFPHLEMRNCTIAIVVSAAERRGILKALRRQVGLLHVRPTFELFSLYFVGVTRQFYFKFDAHSTGCEAWQKWRICCKNCCTWEVVKCSWFCRVAKTWRTRRGTFQKV